MYTCVCLFLPLRSRFWLCSSKQFWICICRITSPVCLLQTTVLYWRRSSVFSRLWRTAKRKESDRDETPSVFCVCVCVALHVDVPRWFFGWRDAIWLDRKESRYSETHAILIQKRGVAAFLLIKCFSLFTISSQRRWLMLVDVVLSLSNELATSVASSFAVSKYQTCSQSSFFFVNAQINFKRHLPIVDQIYSTWLQFWIECGRGEENFVFKCRLDCIFYKCNFALTYSWAAILQASSSTKCWDWSHFSAFFATNIQEVCSWARARDM